MVNMPEARADTTFVFIPRPDYNCMDSAHLLRRPRAAWFTRHRGRRKIRG